MPPTSTLVQAGKLKERVQIIEPVITQDSFGGIIQGSTLVKSVKASIENVSGREIYAAEQMNSEITHKVRIRWRTGIRSQQLVLYHDHEGRDRTFQIQYIINPEEGKTVLELMCIERAESSRGV